MANPSKIAASVIQITLSELKLVQISARICLKQLRKVSVMDLIPKNTLNGITIRSIDIGKAENAAANTLFFRDFVEKSRRLRWFRGRFRKQEMVSRSTFK
jgi:hypothetical protein